MVVGGNPRGLVPILGTAGGGNPRGLGPILGTGGALGFGTLRTYLSVCSSQELIRKHEHADAARRLPSVRILEFFGGRLHREQMDQGVARSTVENILKQTIFSWDPKNFGTAEHLDPEP